MGELSKEPLMQEYPLPGHEEERAGYTGTAYFMFLVLSALAVLITRYFLF